MSGAGGPGRAARAAVTVGLPAVALGVARIPLPGMDLARHGIPPGEPAAGVLAFGLAPAISAFVAVELLALAVPRWRRLRHGGAAGRAPLLRAALALTLALAAFQAYGVVTYLGSIGGIAETGKGPDPRLLVAVTLVAGTASLVWAAAAIGRYGLGNGYAVLVSAFALADLARSLRASASAGAAGGPPIFVPFAVLLSLAAVVPTLRALLANEAGRGDGPRIRDPASGIVPVSMASALLLLPATLSVWFPALREAAVALQTGTAIGTGALLVLSVALAALLARLFHPRATVAALLPGAPGAPEEAGARAAAALSRARLRAMVLVGLFVLLPAVLGLLATTLILLPSALVPLLVSLAVVADLAAEWRARGACPELVAVAAEQRLEAADAAADALRAAGIAALTRGAHFRTLHQFFAPFAPVEILVPADRAAEAERIVAPLLDAAAGQRSTRSTQATRFAPS